ncbi:MAG TPA: DegV family protein [Dehalococcoidia bacterium]|nr:DegV family protein [Dehalococcoidia bacterium]
MERYGIEVVPVNLVHEGRVYRDGLDLTPEEFYRLLREAKKLPTTSPASPGDYLEVFRRVGEKVRSILCISVSARLSGMFDSARAAVELAREVLPRTAIRVLDSGTAAMAQGFVVLAAARAARAEKDLQEVTETAARIMPLVELVAVLDTLHYLARGGRVPKVAAWATSLLQIKPILTLSRGEVGLLERVHTRKKALSRLVQIMRERVGGKRTLHVSVFHANALGAALALREEIIRDFQPQELYLTQFTSVMGVHTGPGVVGLAYYAED